MIKHIKNSNNSEFRYLFNFKDELATGRKTMYIYNILITVTNSLITGVMYTAFLTLNGINIVNVSIITFIPYVAWIFSMFTPIIYSRIKRRRALLVFNTTFYYTCIIFATTIMPKFVSDPTQITIWFAVLLLVGNISNALFGSGSTAWHIHYISEERSRTGFIAYSNIAITVISTVVSISSAIIADSLQGSPKQAIIISVMRYIAYVVALMATLFLWLRPKVEYPYPKSKKKLKFLDVIKDPISSKAFLYTALIFFLYNFVTNVNAGSWNYYVMNTLGYKMIIMYTNGMAYMLSYVFLLSRWRKSVVKHNYFKVYLLAISVSMLLEIPMGLTRSGTVWIYIITSILQGINIVGVSYINSNLFYINLPLESTDTCIVFWNLGTNIFALIGSLAGTFFISFTEKTGPYNINFNFWFIQIENYTMYGSQLLVYIKSFLYLLLGIFIIFAMRNINRIKAQAI